MNKKRLIWVGTTQGTYTLDGEKYSSFEIPEGKINQSIRVSKTKMIHCIIEDSKGKIWFSTNGGVYIYDGVTLTNLTEKEGLSSNFVGQIIESKDGIFGFRPQKGFINTMEKQLLMSLKRY